MSLSLWLVPPVTLRAEIATIIDNYAEELSTPHFVPHLTLLGGIERGVTPDELRALARETAGVTIEPRGIVTGDDFYHCVFMSVIPTPELRRVRAAAERIFGASAEPFRPHMSLVYGDLPRATKDAVAREIEATRFAAFAPDVLEAVETSGTPERWPSKVQVALR
jgi:2'-5' RNA ligase